LLLIIDDYRHYREAVDPYDPAGTKFNFPSLLIELSILLSWYAALSKWNAQDISLCADSLGAVSIFYLARFVGGLMFYREANKGFKREIFREVAFLLPAVICIYAWNLGDKLTRETSIIYILSSLAVSRFTFWSVDKLIGSPKPTD